MNILRVLKEVGYSALSRVAGTDPIRNLPCPVVPHKNQTNSRGPAMLYPPGCDGPDDPGTLTCRNCDQSWGAVKLAEELAVTSEVIEGRERYVPPRGRSAQRKKMAQVVEPIAIHDVWIKAQATTPQSRLAFEYFKRRWRSAELADMATQYVGWTSGFRQDYWTKYKEYLLFVPLHDVHGSIVSGVRRFVGRGKTKLKSLRLPNEAVGLPSGEPVWFGDPPPAAANYCKNKVLYIAEGEIDTLLLMCMREAGYIEGGILGFQGGVGPKWWDATAELLKESPVSVVMVMDTDSAGDRYWQRSAQAFPNAERAILPDFSDLTDCVARFGAREGVTCLNAAARCHHQFYQLDSGRFAYLAGDTWYEGSGRNALNARLRTAGFDAKAAQGIIGALPPARDIIFDPNSTQSVTLSRNNTWLNQFRGLPLSPGGGDHTAYVWLLYWLCGQDDDAFQYVLDWLAKPLQCLYRGKGAHRNKTALIFHGIQGSGKGFFWGPDGMMKAIYGRMMTELMQEQMEDKFAPSTLTRSLMVVANEVACSGYRDAKTLNKIKAWITEPTVMVRRMHRAGEEYPIWFNMVLMSNDSMPIRLEPGDRRYSIFYQDSKLDPGVITTLIDERNAGWPGAQSFLKFLLDKEVARDLAVPHINTARTALLDASKPSDQQFAELIMELGVSTVIKDWEAALGEKRAGPFTDASKGFVGSAHLHEVYKFWCSQHGTNFPVRWPQLKATLLKAIPEARELTHALGSSRKRGLAGLPMGGEKNLFLLEPKAARLPEDDA